MPASTPGQLCTVRYISRRERVKERREAGREGTERKVEEEIGRGGTERRKNADGRGVTGRKMVN